MLSDIISHSHHQLLIHAQACSLRQGDILAIDRAYIDYGKFEQFTGHGVIYMTKLKKGLRYTVLSDTMYQTHDGIMEARIQELEYVKQKKGGASLRRV